MGGIVTCTRNSQIQKPMAGSTISHRAQSHGAPAPLGNPCIALLEACLLPLRKDKLWNGKFTASGTRRT
jgi:hypothetical protein